MAAASEPLLLHGWAAAGDGDPVETTIRLESDTFNVAPLGSPPWTAFYRDVGSVAVADGVGRIGLGEGDVVQVWRFERMGPALGTLVGGLRAGRLRQWLSDGLLDTAASEPIELVEVAIERDQDAADGIAQLVYHDRGVVLVPLDEHRQRLRIPRAEIQDATNERGTGRVAVIADGVQIELRGLGALEERHRQRWLAARDAAAADMAAIVGARLPDAPFAVRQQVTSGLREGRPVGATQLGPAWPMAEAAFLTEPTFAASYRALLARAGGTAGGTAGRRWLAAAPARPGDIDDPRAWFLVALPGNLVALELVSAGAHATYLFRCRSRASFDGDLDDASLLAAVDDISRALLDARFLREPMAIPAERLVEPSYLRYRLALAVLPSLAAARRRFVARIVHSDPTAWAAAIDDLVAWHGASRDEDAIWPGVAGQEESIANGAQDDPS